MFVIYPILVEIRWHRRGGGLLQSILGCGRFESSECAMLLPLSLFVVEQSEQYVGSIKRQISCVQVNLYFDW